MSLVKVFMFVLAISLIMWITGIADPPGTGIYQLATNASQWDNSMIVEVVVEGLGEDIGLTAGGITVAIGAVIGSELLILLGLLPWLISMGKPLITLHGLLVSSFGPEIAAIFAGGIIIIFIVSILNWWRRGE